jgi:glycine/D-amino acid oxidase-like deaminating enzyme
MYSLIVLTEPLSQSQWSQIGWQRREALSSTRLSIDYLQRTDDGRILFGGRGAPYHFGSQIKDSYDLHSPTHALLQSLLLQWFPSLQGIRFTHSWGGPLGFSRDWMPRVTFNRTTKIAVMGGYVGQGVAVSNLAARSLVNLISDQKDVLSELPFVGHVSPKWEPEPLRWLGARLAQAGLARVDARAERLNRPPTGRSWSEQISAH